MSFKLSEQFLEVALGPARRASRDLAAGKVGMALAELTQDRLVDGVRRAVGTVAKTVGLAPLAVFRRLPMQDIEATAHRVGSSQAQAAALWNARTGVQEGQSPPPILVAASKDGSISTCKQLNALALEVRGEKTLSMALGTLADELTPLISLLEDNADRIQTAPDLIRAYRRRRRIRLAIVLFVVLVVGGGGGGFGYVHMARQRIDGALAGEPCEAGKLAELDLRFASDAQLETIERHEKACEQQREEEKKAAEAVRIAEEQKKAEQKKREEEKKRCESLKQHFTKNALDEHDDELLGKNAKLLRRLAAGALEPADVAIELAPLPCKDSDAEQAIGEALAKAAMAMGVRWVFHHTPSEGFRKLIVEHKGALDPYPLELLSGTIEVHSKEPVRTGAPKDIRHWATLCRLKEDLGQSHQGGNCPAVLGLEKNLP